MRRLLLVLPFILAACGETRYSNPPRTATEQFIISTAAEHAVQEFTLTPLDERRIFIDDARVLSDAKQRQDYQYMIGTLRQALLEAGARLAPAPDDADIIIEPRSGGLSIDSYEFFVGIPGDVLGPALSGAGGGNIQLNQKDLALVRNVRQWGFGGLSLLAYWRDSGELVTFAGPHTGRSHVERWRFFILGGRTLSDVPTTQAPE